MKSIKSEIKSSISRYDGIWVVPFEILGDTVPDIYRLKIWIITVIESPTIRIELIGELQMSAHFSLARIAVAYHKIELSPVASSLRVGRLWGVKVNEADSLIFE